MEPDFNPQQNTPEVQPVLTWPIDAVTQQVLRRWLKDQPDDNVVVRLTDAATVLTDARLGDIYELTTTQNFTMANPTNPINGKKIVYKIKQDATGSRVITWGSAFRETAAGTLPVLSTTAAYVDIVGFVYDSAVDKWNCWASKLGFAS